MHGTRLKIFCCWHRDMAMDCMAIQRLVWAVVAEEEGELAHP